MPRTIGASGAVNVADDDELVGNMLRRCWLPVASSDELKGAPLGVRLLDELVVLARFKGGVRAYRDLCPHRGTRLSLGVIIDDCLRCAYHGWRFAEDGRCVSIPADPTVRVPGRARLRTYQCREAAGIVWVCLADATPLLPLPTFPEMEDRSFRLTVVPSYDWRCGALRRVENFMDLAHLPWVHDGVLGTSARPETPEHQVERLTSAIQMSAEVTELANMKSAAGSGSVDMSAGSALVTHNKWLVHMPVSLWWSQELAAGNVYGAFLTASPLTTGECRTFTILFRNFDLDKDDAEYIDFQLEIAEADRWIAESQRPAELPFDITAELHVKGPDQFTIEYRRWIGELCCGNSNASSGGVPT